MTPRVALDVTAGRLDRGGSGEHVRQLARALGAAVIPVSCPGTRPPRMPRTWSDRAATLHRDLWWAQHAVVAAARAAGAELLHLPVPIGPVATRLPLVVTVHDLFALTNPGRFRRWHRAYTAATLPRLVARARAVIAVSTATREALLAHTTVVPERIHVIPNGVAPVFAPRQADDPELAALRTALALPPRYLLAVGQIEPRKNLERLVAAARRAASRPEARDLVLLHAGPAGWGESAARVPALAAESGGVVRLVGPLEAPALAALVAGAVAVTYPSLDEGFGLPVAEAMASGTPVLCSSAGGLAETAGDAAHIVDPHDDAAMADGLVRLWTDAALRADLTARGLARAARWRWPAVAEATRAVYDAALG